MKYEDEHIGTDERAPGDVLAASRIVRRAGYTVVKREAYRDLHAEVQQWRATFGESALKNAADVLAERDRLRDLSAALEGQLAEIERYAYQSGASAHAIRRSILRVFEEAQP